MAVLWNPANPGIAFYREAIAPTVKPLGFLLSHEVDRDKGDVVGFGFEALGLAARAAGRVRVLRPVRNGQLVDLDLVEAVLVEALRRAGVSRLSRRARRSPARRGRPFPACSRAPRLREDVRVLYRKDAS